VVSNILYFPYFSIIYGIILPIDELIFFRGVGQPPTSKVLPRYWCSMIQPGFILAASMMFMDSP
jgi:membrane protease YdiL (CAAX protease family)